MRSDTKIWARFQSSGYPRFTPEDQHGTVREIALALGKWLLQVPMNKRIVIVMAPTQEGLDQRIKGQTEQDMIAMLDELMNGQDHEIEQLAAEGYQEEVP